MKGRTDMMKRNSFCKLILGIVFVATLIVTAFPTHSLAAKRVSLNKTKIVLNIGKTKTLKIKNNKKKLSKKKIKKVTWKSSNKKVATVKYSGKYRQNGKITARCKGICTISVRFNGKIYKCKVTVKDKTSKKNQNSTEQEQSEEVKPKYSYRIYPLTGDAYLGVSGSTFNHATSAFYYIKTDNPDIKNINFYKPSGLSSIETTINWENLKNELGIIETYKGFAKVDGGYVVAVGNVIGQHTFYVNEMVDGENVQVLEYKYTVKDMWGEDFYIWAEKILAECTTPDMDDCEKMFAITNYLRSKFYYKIDRPSLRTMNQPYYTYFVGDSFDTPVLLAKMGQYIGCDIEILYDKYPIGSEEWILYHSDVKGQFGDKTWFFSCCRMPDVVYQNPDTDKVDFSQYK